MGSGARASNAADAIEILKGDLKPPHPHSSICKSFVRNPESRLEYFTLLRVPLITVSAYVYDLLSL